jgi:hypothetical protein
MKLYLRNNSIKKAFKFIIKIETRSLFQAINWYQTLIELIEQKSIEITLKSKDSGQKPLNNQQDNKILLSIMHTVLLHHYILNLLRMRNEYNPYQSLETLILKFDICLNDLKHSLLANKQLNDILMNEYHSQYYYIMGLFLIKVFKRNYASGLDEDMSNLRSCYLEANVCFAKSSLISMPNPQQSFSNSKNLDDFIPDLIKLINRESTWRYSVIANWFKYLQSSKLYSNIDQLLFVKQIIEHGNQFGSNLRQKILEVIQNEEKYAKLTMLDDFKLNLLDQNKAVNKFHFIGNAVSEYADKQCLAGQSSNLNYLVWHNLVNVKKAGVDLISIDSNEKVFPYCKCFCFFLMNNDSIIDIILII